MCRWLTWVAVIVMWLGGFPGEVFAWSDFNGTTSRIVIPHNASLSATTWSFGCWTRRTGDGENANSGRIADKSPLNSSSGWAILNEAASNSYQIDVRFGDMGNWRFTRPAANIWMHVLFTMDASNSANNPVAYINGVSVTVNETNTPAVGAFVPGTNALVIGDRSNADRSWAGQIAHCAYWDRVLASDEVKSVACPGVRCSPLAQPRSLIGLWPLGPYGGRNYTRTVLSDGVMTDVTLIQNGPPITYPPFGGW